LLGEEEGLAEAAHEFGVKHIPHVERNANGVPLISSMFKLARENSNSELLCIINADMILMPDFAEAVKKVKVLKSKFVLLSQRWDLDMSAPIDFSGDWIHGLRSTVNGQGQLHRPAGSDFFLFPKNYYQDIPAFIIGLAGWDNWMIYKAHAEKWPVIDCTPSVMIVHQNHGLRGLDQLGDEFAGCLWIVWRTHAAGGVKQRPPSRDLVKVGQRGGADHRPAR
jgi:hypothetical protein